MAPIATATASPITIAAGTPICGASPRYVSPTMPNTEPTEMSISATVMTSASPKAITPRTAVTRRTSCMLANDSQMPFEAWVNPMMINIVAAAAPTSIRLRRKLITERRIRRSPCRSRGCHRE